MQVLTRERITLTEQRNGLFIREGARIKENQTVRLKRKRDLKEKVNEMDYDNTHSFGYLPVS